MLATEPKREKKASNWRVAEVMLPDEVCRGCRGSNPVGSNHCFQCDPMQEKMPDIKKLARVVPWTCMRDIAKKAVLRNEEYDSLCERLINDPFYAYGAARGGPDAFCS